MVKLLVLVVVLLANCASCSGQLLDPYMMYGGGMALYGGINPYLYSGLANYGAYNNLMFSPYNTDVQSALLASYNPMAGLNTGAFNTLNPAFGTSLLGNIGNSNVLDSGSTVNGLNPVNHGVRNRLQGLSRDSAMTRLQSNSMFDCGFLSARPCGGSKLRSVGAGTNWENTHDNRR